MRNIRKARNITQKDLALELGVSKAHISKIESGLHDPKCNLTLKMLKFMLPDISFEKELIKAEVLATYRSL